MRRQFKVPSRYYNYYTYMFFCSHFALFSPQVFLPCALHLIEKCDKFVCIIFLLYGMEKTMNENSEIVPLSALPHVCL